MRNSHITVTFSRDIPRVWEVSASPPSLLCWWMPPWLLKASNWLVKHWFTVPDKRMEQCIKTTTIRVESVIRAILDQRDNIAMIYGRRCRGVLIGPEQAGMAAHECGPLIRFDAPIELNGPEGFRICNLPVEVIPWMDGVLLLPK